MRLVITLNIHGGNNFWNSSTAAFYSWETFHFQVLSVFIPQNLYLGRVTVWNISQIVYSCLCFFFLRGQTLLRWYFKNETTKWNFHMICIYIGLKQSNRTQNQRYTFHLSQSQWCQFDLMLWCNPAAILEVKHCSVLCARWDWPMTNLLLTSRQVCPTLTASCA